MTTTDEVHEELVAARNKIDRDGWLRFHPYWSDGEDARCALSALAYASGQRPLAAATVLGRVVGCAPTDIPRWNDAPGRTKAEVLAAFDKAIAATAPSPPDPFDGQTIETVEEVAA